jgi:flagellin
LLGIQTNLGSLMAQRNLGKSQVSAQAASARLSSGYRINGAQDDAAGLAVAESLRSQRRATVVAERNAADAISMVQTAEGALGEVSNLVQRMRELAVQASNGALADTDRGFLHTEFQELQEEIARVLDGTSFNGRNLLGEDPSRAPQIGTVTFTGPVYGIDSTWLDLEKKFDFLQYDTTITYVTDPTARLGGTEEFQVGIQNTAADRIAVDFYRPDLRALLGVSATPAATPGPIVFPGGTITTYEGGFGSLNNITETAPSTLVPPNISSNVPSTVLPAAIYTASDARSAIDVLDESLRAIGEKRAYFGALLNRFDVVTATLQTQRLNVAAAESRIRDVDVADETSSQARAQVGVQAGTSVLAQANTAPQGALALLRG